MFSNLKMWLAAFCVFALGTCTGCATSLGGIVPSQTYDAVTEDCLTLETISDEALCLLGGAAIAIDELAEAREEGKLKPQVVDALDPVINAVAPRLEASALLWGGVAGYYAQLEVAKGAISEGDYLALTVELQQATAQAVSDWTTLKPRVIDLILLKEDSLGEGG